MIRYYGTRGNVMRMLHSVVQPFAGAVSLRRHIIASLFCDVMTRLIICFAGGHGR